MANRPVINARGRTTAIIISHAHRKSIALIWCKRAIEFVLWPLCLRRCSVRDEWHRLQSRTQWGRTRREMGQMHCWQYPKNWWAGFLVIDYVSYWCTLGQPVQWTCPRTLFGEYTPTKELSSLSGQFACIENVLCALDHYMLICKIMSNMICDYLQLHVCHVHPSTLILCLVHNICLATRV